MRIILHKRGEELFNCWRDVLKTRDPEDIHDLRVASRRLREGLAMFSVCYSARTIEAIDRRVKKLTRLLGDMRDTDEAIVFFNAMAEEASSPACHDELLTFVDTIRGKRKRQTHRMVSGLRKMDRKGLLSRYRRVINGLSLFSPPEQGVDPMEPLSGFTATAFNSRFAAIMELLGLAGEQDAIEERHRLRIAIKHFRYRMELLSFLFGDSYEQLYGIVKRYQDVLGTMNDLEVFGRMIRNRGFSTDVERELLECIAAKQRERFRALSALMESSPLKMLGEKVRNSCET